MSRVTFLIDRVGRLRKSLEPKRKPIKMLPDVWIDDEGGDWPGHEEENAKARRYAAAVGLEVKVYGCTSEWNPDMDGVEL